MPASQPPIPLSRLPFFFFAIPRPPLSTLFPYTTLFRSAEAARRAVGANLEPRVGDRRDAVREDAERRSEEHTSELQSRVDLVCRLLLDKKKGWSRRVTTGRRKVGASRRTRTRRRQAATD